MNSNIRHPAKQAPTNKIYKMLIDNYKIIDKKLTNYKELGKITNNKSIKSIITIKDYQKTIRD